MTNKKTEKTERKTSNRSRTKKMNQNERLNKVIKEVLNTKNTVNIDGEDYVKVHERRKIFREEFGFDVKIQTIMKEFSTGYVIFEAQIFAFNEKTKDWELVSNGHAYESKASSDFNKHNFLENCETSAVGRALEGLGIGNNQMSESEAIKSKVKSKSPVSEVSDKKAKNHITPSQVEELEKLVKEEFGSLDKGLPKLLKERKASKLSELTLEDYTELKILLKDEEDTVL
tara:strand:- start:86724 stop:87410 length:687 start_codon:yes stop_codon:yes gene_type:complete